MKRLSELRKAGNMSQSQLGEKLNLCQQQISAIERGTVSATEDVIVKTAELFAVSTDYLLDIKSGTNYNNNFEENGQYNVQSIEVQILNYMKCVPEKGKQMILEMARVVYNSYNQ